MGGGFRIKHETVYKVYQLYQENVSSVTEDIDACREKINALIGDRGFAGKAAESVRNYLSEVHLSLLSSLSDTADLLWKNAMMYLAGYGDIDASTNFVISEDYLTGDLANLLSDRYGTTETLDESVQTCVTTASEDVSGLSVPRVGPIEDELIRLSNQIVEFVGTVSEYESQTVAGLRTFSEDQIPLLRSIITGLDETYPDVTGYQQGSFYENEDYNTLASMELWLDLEYGMYDDYFDQVEDALAELDAAIEARRIEGIQDTVKGLGTIAIGAFCIACTAGAATPIIIAAGLVVGGGAVLSGASDTAEGAEEIYMADCGDIDTDSFNMMRDTLFMGNEDAYNAFEDICVAGCSIITPYGKASSAGELKSLVDAAKIAGKQVGGKVGSEVEDYIIGAVKESGGDYATDAEILIYGFSDVASVAGDMAGGENMAGAITGGIADFGIDTAGVLAKDTEYGQGENGEKAVDRASDGADAAADWVLDALFG